MKKKQRILLKEIESEIMMSEMKVGLAQSKVKSRLLELSRLIDKQISILKSNI